MNGACPIGNIKSQIGKYCALYCGCSGLEVGIRITGTLLGMKLDNEGPMICMDSFFREIKLKLNLPKNFDFKGPRPQDLGLDIFTYLDILSSKGVRNRMKSGTAWPKTCKISSYKTVSNNFEKICEVLARGIPLFAAIRTGKSFIDLKPNEIYVPPREDQITKGKSHGKHAILLFGAGMTPEGDKYYNFVNSYDEDFCELTKPRKDGIKGGFGKVIAYALSCDPLYFCVDIEDE